MAPTKTDTAHGALYDLFPEHAENVHGSNLYDEGFALQDKGSPKGSLFDEFGAPTEDTAHGGPPWDDFAPWQSVDEAHGGLLYDQGFSDHTANTSDRGTLFDLFGGKQARYMFDGQDAEGIVVNVREDGIAEVQPRQGGQIVEVELGQFLALASPSMDNAGTTAPRSTAEAPSAWSRDAHGGRGALGTAPSPGEPIEPTPQGQATEARSGVPEGSWDVALQLKTILGDVDVAKAMGAKVAGAAPGYRMTEGPNSSAVDHWDGRSGRRIGSSVSVHPGHVVAFHQGLDETSARIRNMARKTLPSDSLKGYSLFTVAKEVSVAETAIQAEDNAAAFAGPKNAGSYCPECRQEKAKLTDDGRCPDCNTVIKAHEKAGPVPREKGDGNGNAESSAEKGVAEKTTSVLPDVFKAFGAPGDARPGGQTNTAPAQQETPSGKPKQAKGDPPDVPVPERAHKTSDHHESPSDQPRTCPHCGQPLKEEEYLTSEGAPSDPASGGGKYDPPVTAHKCATGSMGQLLSVWDAAEVAKAQAKGLAYRRLGKVGVHIDPANGEIKWASDDGPILSLAQQGVIKTVEIGDETRFFLKAAA